MIFITDKRPCATSKRTSDTKFPEGDPALVADNDGCELVVPTISVRTDDTVHRAKVWVIY
jgi:hypothetical protein